MFKHPVIRVCVAPNCGIDSETPYFCLPANQTVNITDDQTVC